MIMLLTCTVYFELMLISLSMAIGSSMVEIAVLPLMGYFINKHHAGHHGSVYALWSLSYTLALLVGPVVGGVTDDGNSQVIFGHGK